jgi:hypothetical protein
MKIERLGKGRLTLAVTKFDLRQTATPQPFAEALDWIEFSGEACVPR